MTKISYEINGSVIEIEVNDDCANAYKEMVKKQENRNRAETRRHQSLELSIKGGYQFRDESADIEKQYIMKEEKKALYRAIKQLLPQQQELIRKIYFENKGVVEIAKEEGVSHQAISDRLKKIITSLKKNLN